MDVERSSAATTHFEKIELEKAAADVRRLKTRPGFRKTFEPPHVGRYKEMSVSKACQCDTNSTQP